MEQVAETMPTMADANNVELQLFIDPETPEWVLSDQVRLRQILLNLTNNAVKFSKQEKGALVVLDEGSMVNNKGIRQRLMVSVNGHRYLSFDGRPIR